MRTVRVRRRVAWFAGALVLLLQMSPALAGGQSGKAKHQSSRPIEVTYTKWVKVVDGFSLLEGFTGGDVEGVFAGQVLRSQLSYDGRILLLEAIYEVQAGDRSFTALIRGGRTTNPGDAVLDGVILDGWRTGAAVHVEFQRILAPSPTESGCFGAPAGLTCFEGTIQVGRVPGN